MSTNLIFLGSVDNGKSTLAGRILVETHTVTDQEVERCKRLASEKGMQGWYLAYLLDTSEEEMNSGKTHEVGSIEFQHQSRKYNILDAPGHTAYISKMIYALSMADIGVLLISARGTEFESSIKGSLVEHLSLAKVMGIRNLIVAINKIDLCSDQERIKDIKKQTSKLCQRCGYLSVPMFEISAYQGIGITGLLDGISATNIPSVDVEKEFRMSIAIADQNKVYGKIYQGTVQQGDKVKILPTQQETTVKAVEDGALILSHSCRSGDFLAIGDVKPTYSILCEIYSFDFLVTGTQCMLHIHTTTLDCEVKIVGAPILRERTKGKVIITTDQPFFTEKNQRWSNIALRTNKTIAIGVVTGIKY